MKHFLATALFALGLSCAHEELRPDEDVPLETPTDPGADIETLLQLERERARAISEADAFALGNLLDDGFVSVDVEGIRRNGPMVLERLRAEGTQAERHVRLNVEDFAARVTRDSAVVTGRDIREEGVGRARTVTEIAFTHTWRWRAGAWRWAASHESRVAR